VDFDRACGLSSGRKGTILRVSDRKSVPHRIRKQIDAQVRNNPHRLIRAIDYVVVSADRRDGPLPAGHASPVELSHGVRIERIEDALAERIFDATSLRGENWSPSRLFHAVHAYVREAWAEDDGTEPDAVGRWDYERRLWPVVQLSRLIRDNNVSTEHAAQRQIRAD
jgi:hypothetical protein